ncbi:SAV_2336 N-terminal domain-related protein [Streptomyces sp. NPDC049837]|uniref:SAV_2336 N-terminal domain-related protein n=1 Tax=Streptomyces sp. NPDC049837 TaxID=3155277 RepID=UPI003442BC26
MPAAPSPAPGSASGLLTELVARLREADLGPTCEEVADALWLAQWVTPTGRSGSTGAGTEPAPHPPPPGPSGDAHPRPAPLPPAQPHEEAPGGAPREGRAGLSAPGGSATPGDSGDGADGGARVWVPTAATLPDPIALQRALRPLQRFQAPRAPVRRVLDERATADRAADTGLTVPVLRRERRREARVQLLMDVSSSTVVWQQTLEELRTVCERAGAFRDVSLLYLHAHADGTPGVATTPTRPATPLRSPAQLADPTGRKLTLLLSDCAGPMWRTGELHRLLHRWAATAPVAVVQPLPQRMWRNAQLPAWPGVLRRPEGAGGRLTFTTRAARPPGAVPVPVLAPNRIALETWARLVSATGQLSLPGAAGWVGAGPPPAPPGPAARPHVTPAERVRAFRCHASPSAVRLAEYLSLVPLVLPVMQLVQRAMLVGSGPDVLAEVLLGGLLRRSDEDHEGDDATEPAYEFLPGVREELMARQEAGDAHLVLKKCSQYLEQRFGTGVRNFPAMAAAYLAGTVESQGGADDPRLRRFAVVSTQVLRHFLVPPPVSTAASGPADLAARARESLARFRRQNTARDLDAAVQLLSAAARATTGRAEQAPLYAELAEALLERWRARALGEDLRDALAAAERAVPEAPGAYGTLARVLRHMEQEVDAAGADTDAVPDRFREEAGRASQGRASGGGASGDRASEGGEAEGGAAEPEAVRFLLLTYAEECLREAYATAPGRAGRTALAHVRLLQRLAVEFAEQAVRLLDPAPEGPDQWAAGLISRALDVLDAADPLRPPEAVRYFRGLLFLHLARRRGAVRPEAVPDLARTAADELNHALTALEHTLAHQGAENGEPDWTPQPVDLFTGWMAVASAEELTASGATVLMRVRRALERARAVAERYPAWEGRDEQLADCLQQTVRVWLQLYGPDDGHEPVDETIAILEEALRLAPSGTPLHREVLIKYGSTLLVRKPAELEEVEAVVRIFREAVDFASEASEELATYRVQLGHALYQRFRLRGALTDLHEADWILGAGARGTDDPGISGLAWMLRGDVAVELQRTTGATVRLTEAAGHFHRAAEDALATGNAALAAAALRKRATCLEDTAGPARALAEYRKALRLLEGTPDAEVLTSALQHDIARLRAGEAEE